MNKPKICEFGYVLCDDKFKILKDEDILINPGKGGSFTNNHRGDFKYSHPLYEYYKAKEYPKYYELIKNLILDEDTIVFGFSITLDVSSIKIANYKYNLEDYEYRIFDVQKCFPEYKESKIKLSLDYLFRQYYNDDENYYGIVNHQPDDDAYMTMLVLKKLLDENNQTLKEFIESNPDAFTNIKKDNKWILFE